MPCKQRPMLNTQATNSTSFHNSDSQAPLATRSLAHAKTPCQATADFHHHHSQLSSRSNSRRNNNNQAPLPAVASTRLIQLPTQDTIIIKPALLDCCSQTSHFSFLNANFFIYKVGILKNIYFYLLLFFFLTLSEYKIQFS